MRINKRIANTLWGIVFMTSCINTCPGQNHVKAAREIFSDLPGALPIDDKNLVAFEETRKKKGQSYQPRTKHLKDDGWAKYTNRLFLESSSYLLQHAHNPVNWYPWSDEAFETARKLN